MAKELVVALKAMEICRTLSAPELDSIAAIVETQEVAAGKDLFREGDPGDGMFLVVSGEIDVVKSSPRGERSLARLAAGAVLGEISLLTNEVRSATGRALVNTSVLRLPSLRFRALLDAGSPAALKIVAAIAQVLGQRLARMNSKVLELADKVDPEGKAPSAMKDRELAELHRSMQIWSF